MGVLFTFDRELIVQSIACLIAAVLLVAGFYPRRRGLFILGGILGLCLCGYAMVMVANSFRPRYAATSGAALILLLALLIAGFLLLRRGIRGRRVGDHPFCRRCGFDLFGKPASSTLCSECGADLVPRNATVVGVLHRRPRAMVGGLFLILLGVTAFYLPSVRWVRSLKWYDIVPDRLLVREFEGYTEWNADSANALFELHRRRTKQTLSDALYLRTLNHCLDRMPPENLLGLEYFQFNLYLEALRLSRVYDDDEAQRFLDMTLEQVSTTLPMFSIVTSETITVLPSEMTLKDLVFECKESLSVRVNEKDARVEFVTQQSGNESKSSLALIRRRPSQVFRMIDPPSLKHGDTVQIEVIQDAVLQTDISSGNHDRYPISSTVNRYNGKLIFSKTENMSGGWPEQIEIQLTRVKSPATTAPTR
jgi:hypothetical protein